MPGTGCAAVFSFLFGCIGKMFATYFLVAVRGRNRSRRPGFLPDERNGTIGM